MATPDAPGPGGEQPLTSLPEEALFDDLAFLAFRRTQQCWWRLEPQTEGMSQPVRVHLTLQNLSKKRWTVSLEPYGDYCELGPDGTAHATWELRPDGVLALEIGVTDDALLVGDVSSPMSELRPNRSAHGGDLWA